MFDWQWYFVYYLIHLHIGAAAFSIYVHRTIGHGHFTILSKKLEYVLRFIIWLPGELSYRWAETYACRHRIHHGASDTEKDPHSPYWKTFKQLCQPWIFDPEDAKKYCPEIKTPNDWMQRVMFEKYRHLGPWVRHLLAGILFGPIGLVLSILVRYATKQWLGVFIGNYMNHKIGFNYAGHRSPQDRSKNVFPLGILLAGEELHNNHHNYPKSPKFSKYWFEIDIGYFYARIFEKLGWLKFNKEVI